MPRVLQEARSSGSRISVDADLVKYHQANAPALSRNDNFGLPLYRAEEIINDIASQYPALPKAIIVESANDLPIDDALKSDDIEGMFYKGKVYINTSAISTEERMREVYAHEAIGHMSVEGMLNEADPKLMPKLINQVILLDTGGNKYIRELAKTVDKSQPGLDRKTRAKEIIAQIAERDDQDKDMTPAVRTLWQKVIDAIKAFGKLVFDVEMTDQDVRDIVSTAARYARGEDVSMVIRSGAMFSKSAMQSLEANILRGEKAMNNVLLNKADVKRAMYHNELGWIDFVWGDDFKGVQHIVRQRLNKDGLSVMDVYKLLTVDLVDVIANGKTVRRRDVFDSTRVALESKGYEAILVRNKGNNGWLLSGWRVKAPDAIKAANDANKATQLKADSSDNKLGASALNELSTPAKDYVNHPIGHGGVNFSRKDKQTRAPFKAQGDAPTKSKANDFNADSLLSMLPKNITNKSLKSILIAHTL